MSEADRLLSVVAAYEWAIDVVEAMDRDQALEYLRRVAARQRRDYEEAVEYARARPATEGGVVGSVRANSP